MPFIENDIKRDINIGLFKTLNIDLPNKYLMYPDKKDIRFSTEIEWTHFDREEVYSFVNRNHLKWEVIYDASLYNSGCSDRNTGEIIPKINNKLYFKDHKLKEIKLIANFLKENNAKSGKKCGFHVHIDSKHFVKNAQIIRLITNMYNVQDFLIKVLNVRDSMFVYSRPYPEYFYKNIKKSKNIKELRNNWYDERFIGEVLSKRANSCWSSRTSAKYNATRYTFLNLHRFFLGKNTIEFRLFNGSTDYLKLKAYILFCLVIAENSLDLNTKLIFNKRIDNFFDFANSLKGKIYNKAIIRINREYEQYLIKNKIKYLKDKKTGYVYETE